MRFELAGRAAVLGGGSVVHGQLEEGAAAQGQPQTPQPRRHKQEQNENAARRIPAREIEGKRRGQKHVGKELGAQQRENPESHQNKNDDRGAEQGRGKLEFEILASQIGQQNQGPGERDAQPLDADEGAKQEQNGEGDERADDGAEQNREQ